MSLEYLQMYKYGLACGKDILVCSSKDYLSEKNICVQAQISDKIPPNIFIEHTYYPCKFMSRQYTKFSFHNWS